MGELNKTLLITGCGRSATKYIAVLFSNLGLDVRHEAMGQDGVANWCMAVDCDNPPWGVGRRGIRFKKIFHQVRHPLDVIPSLTTFQSQSWEFIARYIPCPVEEPILLRATKFWYYWNIQTERIAHWRYRVEAIDTVFDELCCRAGVKANRDVLQSTSRLINSRKIRPPLNGISGLIQRLQLDRCLTTLDFIYNRNLSYVGKPLTWDALEEHAPGWVDRIRELSFHYGYTVREDQIAATVGVKKRSVRGHPSQLT
jgi:hypothetical protein